MRTLIIIIQKEFKQIRRNPFLPRLIAMFPILVVLILPFAMTMDVRHIGISVVDNDRSTLSSRIISAIAESEYFSLYSIDNKYEKSYSNLEQGEIDVIVTIPKDFERNLTLSQPEKIDISANAVNSTKGSIGMQYVVQTISKTLSQYSSERFPSNTCELIAVQNRYNPTLNYRHFMIPALITMLIIIICGFIPALNLVVEKENGTIEQINVTPVGKFTFTLGKLIPFWIIGLFIISIAMLLAWWVHDLKPAGSLCLIYLAAFLLILTISGLGVTIANCSDTMQQVMFVMFFFIVIFILMSGLLTPIDSMPRWTQILTYCFPPRYFIEAMRSIYLKGTTFTELWANYAALGGFAVFFNILAALTYKKQS